PLIHQRTLACAYPHVPVPFLLTFFFSDPATTEIYTLSLPRRSSDLSPASTPVWTGTPVRTATPSSFTAVANATAERSVSPRICTDRKSTRLNSSHVKISYAVFCLKKKKKTRRQELTPMTHKTHLRHY